MLDARRSFKKLTSVGMRGFAEMHKSSQNISCGKCMEGNYKAELREDAMVSQNALVITNNVLDARRSIKRLPP